MQNANPYQSLDQETKGPHTHARPRWVSRWVLIGFVFGAFAPAGYGVYGLVQHFAYVSALGPNQASCGTGALAGLEMILVGGPCCGLIGAVLGWVASRSCNSQISGFVEGGYGRLVSGVDSEARRVVEAKYADQWNEAGLLKRWRLQRKIAAEIKALVAESMPNVSSEAMF